MSADSSIASKWNPARTHVFAVGLLEYDDGVHWPLEKRRDVVLMDALRRRGVPDASITFMRDAEATTRGFEGELLQLLDRTRAGEQLLVYYAGHGGRDREHGGGYFKLRDGRLPIAQLFAWIERRFAGELALLTADCCYSGCLTLDAPVRAGRVAYGAIGSSLSTLPSTGAWTFTNCWIDAIEGHIPVDLDGDGVLRLDELARYAERRLCFHDGQVSSFAVANGMPSTFELGPARRRPHPRHGELVEARRDGKWAKAEILDVRPAGEIVVRWLADPASADVDAADVRRWQPDGLRPGTPVEVEYKDRWYDADVLAARNGMHLVRYTGWDRSWDEWVPDYRLRRVHAPVIA